MCNIHLKYKIYGQEVAPNRFYKKSKAVATDIMMNNLRVIR